MAIQIFDVSEEVRAPTIKLLVVGQPGAGKTRWASTWPNPLYINAEGGLLSVRDRKGVKGVNISTMDELKEIKRMLDRSPSVRFKEFGGQIDTVVIDTLDEISNIIKRERMAAEGHTAMQVQDWGYLSTTMQNVVRGFRNLEDLNVIINVHMKRSEDADTGRVTYTPDIQGSFGDQVAGYVDEAVVLKARMTQDPQTGKKELKRWLQTVPDVNCDWIKDRSGALPPRFEINFEDDYARMRKLIFGELTDDEKIADLEELRAELEATAKTKVNAAQANEPVVDEANEPKPAAKPVAKKAAKKTTKAAAKKAETKTEAKAEEAPTPAESAKAEEAPASAPEEATTTPAQPTEPEPVVATPEAKEADVAEAIAEPEETPEEAVSEEGTAVEDEGVALDDEGVSDDDDSEEVTDPDAPIIDTEEETPKEPAVEDAVSTPPSGKTSDDDEPAATPLCADCQADGVEKHVENQDYADLSLIRFKRYLCREHFAAAKSAK